MRRSILALLLLGAAAAANADEPMRRGEAAYGDWRRDAPGTWRLIAPADMPPPDATRAVANPPAVVGPPASWSPRAPAGFAVSRFADALRRPRILRVAPNGDVFVAETAAGRIGVLRAADGAALAAQKEIFARDLDGPFGMAFYPPGADPQWLYVAENNAVLRFPFHIGDLKAAASPQIVIPRLSATSGYHTTRDLAFSADGRTMLVSIGSGSNDAEGGMAREAGRADVLAFDPDGGNRRVFATGLRNCVGLAIQPNTGAPWCAANERDGLGDNLPPDFVTRVQDGGFFGWPWFYIGDHADPHHRGERPDLATRVIVPDVLIQPHSAPLGMAFYVGQGAAAFPREYDGDAFVALHGSWNRARRTGYKVVRVRLRGGVPDGSYEDFFTGFVIDDDSVAGRPVGVAIAHDGALLVSDDANGIVWRVAATRQ